MTHPSPSSPPMEQQQQAPAAQHIGRPCNRENVAKLVAALRSGNYEQGRDRLRVRDRYCCLGVACDISGLGKWDDAGDYHAVVDSSSHSLPGDVAAWLGWDKDAMPFNPTVDHGASSLASLNDDGASFAEIADIIEREWLGGPAVSPQATDPAVAAPALGGSL